VTRAWLCLAAAIAAEIIATSMLRSTEQFTSPGFTVGVLAGFMISFYLLSLVIRRVPLGVAYAVWAGIGTVVVAVIGVCAFDEPMPTLRAIGIVCVVIGVVAVKC
jgi:small multidrug resistance pump